MAVVFSPDGARIASAGFDATVRVWDAVSGDELLTIRGHSDWVWSVAFSPDGRRIASGGGDRTVRVWDAASGEKLLTLSGHSDSVWAVVFSPEGARIASAGNDATVRVWDSASGDELLTVQYLPGQQHASFSAARLLDRSDGAWRWLGWLAPSPATREITRLPAETFGQLPTRMTR